MARHKGKKKGLWSKVPEGRNNPREKKHTGWGRKERDDDF